jgi:hypothetical protein
MIDTPQPDALVAAIEREHAGSDVRARLEVELGVAAALGAAGDDVIDHYVQAARAEGRSWTEIGDVLGITKQGAQKRFAAPVADPVAPWPASFSPDGQAVCARAGDEARALGHRYVGTEHLLLGLFSERGGLAASCLARLQITRAQVLGQIERADNLPPTSLALTPRAKRVLEVARREALRLGHRCPEPEHLLLALCAVRPGAAGDILAGAGATEERARETLAQLLDAQAPELAARVRQRPRRRLARRRTRAE